jgi:hypothetical protein
MKTRREFLQTALGAGTAAAMLPLGSMDGMAHLDAQKATRPNIAQQTVRPGITREHDDLLHVG